MFESLQNIMDDLNSLDASKIEGGSYTNIKTARALLMDLRDEAQALRLKLMNYYYAKHPKATKEVKKSNV